MNNDQLKFNTIPRQGTFGKVVDTTNKNFELAKVAIDGLEYATHRNKGLFGTLEALNAKYPTPNYGDWALVGSSFPCQVYRCDADSHTWVAAGTYQGDNISLNDYVTKAQHNEDMETIEEEIEDLQGAIYGVSVEQELTFNDHGSAQALETTIPLGSKIFLSGDLSEVLGMTNVSDTEYQTITSGTVTDRNVSYIKNGSETGSVIITAIVENGLKRDVEAIKYDYTDFENKLRGVGQNANGSLYPMYNLGDFANINEVNNAVDSAFATQGNTIKQGRLKMRRNGQIIFVDQFAIDFSQGRWAQMAYGMVAPSSQDDGLTLIQATDHPHIVWRMNGVDNGKWRDLEGNISLKTINGNSLYGEGDLTISDAAQIVVDTALDPSSDNAIANSAVAAVVAEIYSTFAEAVQQVMEEKGTIICKVWQGNTNWPSAITTPIGTYGFDTTNKELLRVNDLQGWTHIDLSEEIVYVDAVNNKQYRWNGSYMISIGGGNNVSVVDNVVRGNYNPVTSNAVAVAMSQFGIDEVAVIKCWSDDSQDYDNWEMGDYWYDPTEDELWRCNDQQGAGFEKVLRPIIMLKEPNYDVWIWNTQTAKKFDVETETSISAETAESTNPPTTGAVYAAVSAVQTGVNTNAGGISSLGTRVTALEASASSAASSKDYNDKKLYPEYYLSAADKANLRYCPNYYDWNTVRYNEDIEAPDSQYVQDTQADADVLFPTEHVRDSLSYVQGLVNTSTTPYKLLPQDVYYDTTNARFLLKIGDYYYTSWNNSNLWQNSDGLREDTVYAAITPGDAVSEGGSYYYINQWIVSSGVKTPLIVDNNLNTATNFRSAIVACLMANDGNMKLHGDKIYGVTGSEIFNNLNNFTIDGQGATICYIPISRKNPQQSTGEDEAINGGVLTVQNKSNFVIKNICIKGVRTAVRNVASGYPLSHSSINKYGICCHQCKDFMLKNVEFSGMGYDIGISASGNNTCDRVVIDGWKSKASEGMWVSTTPTMLIINADVTMAPYSSKHTIYGGESRWVKNHVVKDSKFVQNTKYNSNFLQYKTNTNSTAMENDNLAKVNNLTFENCFIKTGRGAEINTKYNPFNLTFENCTILQHHDLASDGSVGYWGSGSVVGMKSDSHGIIQDNSWCNLTIKECKIMAWGMIAYIHNNGDTGYAENEYIPNPIVDIEDTVITMLDLPNYSKYVPSSDVNRIMLFDTGTDFSPKVATFIIKNIHTNAVGMYPTDTGTSRPEANGVIFSNALAAGFSYFNTTLNKTLSIKEFDSSGRRIWIDENGRTYLNDNTPVEGGVPIYEGLSANRPKGAVVGDIYYATDTNKAYRCINRGAQTRMSFTVSRVIEDDVPVPVNGNLKMYFGISGTSFTNATAEQLKKHLVLDVDLQQNTGSESDNALRGWLITEINKKYRDFERYYKDSKEYWGSDTTRYYDGSKHTRKAWENSTGNIFGISTDFGFSMHENVAVPIGVNTSGNATSMGGFTYVFDGVGLTIARYSSYSGAAFSQAHSVHKTVATEIASVGVAQYNDKYQHLVEQKRYEGISTSYADYYTLGFDATWEEISVSEITGDGDVAIQARLANLEATKDNTPVIQLWNDDYQQRSNWLVGDYWYVPTDGELKICASDQLEFDNVANPCVLEYNAGLYFWTGEALYQISLGNIS